MDYNDFQQEIREITSVQDLVDAFVIAHNTVGCISDLVMTMRRVLTNIKILLKQ